TFGCNNGLILSGARVYYAMARDDLFFKSAGVLHPRYKTPAVALVVQAVWTGVLCLSGTYTQLLNFVIFAALVFYMLTAVGLFALRVKRPAAERPDRTPAYPWLPALYVIATGVIAVDLLTQDATRTYSFLGLGLVLIGVPVYFGWRTMVRRAARAGGPGGAAASSRPEGRAGGPGAPAKRREGGGDGAALLEPPPPCWAAGGAAPPAPRRARRGGGRAAAPPPPRRPPCRRTP